MAKVTLTITVKKTGRVNLAYVKIGQSVIELDNGVGKFNATVGTEYWLFWQLEGTVGSGVEILVVDPNGVKKVNLSAADTEIPPKLGLNAGTNSFKA